MATHGQSVPPGGGVPRPPLDLDDGRVVMGRGPGPRARADEAVSGAPKTRHGAAIVGGEDDRSERDGPGPQMMTASTLTGDDVVNGAGEKLGSVKEIMLDVEGGRIAYAVLSFGGFLGLGDKLFAIPWSALRLDADRHCFILDVERERLERAPGFDKDNWPAMADMQWATDLHSYYGREPYWK